jgi:transposase-like protein
MPVHKKKPTTPNSDLTTTEATSPRLPGQQEFHAHLRELIRGATRIVMEEIMQEELSQFLQAAWGESTPSRKGYRTGSYTRDLVTATGRLEDLSVPRDREGLFQTQAFERYSRYEPQVAAALTEMFVSGTSSHKVGEVTKTLLGVAPSASTVSRLNQTLTEQCDAWRVRPLQAHWRILYLDGIHFKIRHGQQCDSSIILTVLGVDLAGNKEVLALRACAEESKEGWLSILQDIRTRGATSIDLLVTDGHEGLLAAVFRIVSGNSAPTLPGSQTAQHSQCHPTPRTRGGPS